MEGDFKKWYFF